MPFTDRLSIHKKPAQQPEPPPPGGTRGLIVSDTHFGAPYSDAVDAENLLRHGLEYSEEFGKTMKDGESTYDPAQFCILLGDIYEFINHRKKKDLGEMKKVVAEQMKHLYGLVTEHPDCKFIYVLGNHERVPMFDEAIDALALQLKKENEERAENKDPLKPVFKGLELQRHFKKIGDGLFMHGDQAMSPDKYHVTLDKDLVNDYSNADRRYDESNVEINRWKPLQYVHDGLNVFLPWFVGRALHRPSQCATAVFNWCHKYDEEQIPAQDRPSFTAMPVQEGALPELREKMRRVKDTVIGPDIVSDPEKFRSPRPSQSLSILSVTEPPSHILEGVHHIFMGHTHDPFTAKVFLDPQNGTPYNFYNTGASIFRMGLGKQINRHCFNALNVYLDSADIENPDTHITAVNSFKWPQHHWPKEEEKTVQAGR